MNKLIQINKEEFKVKDTEYIKVPHEEFNNLIILNSLGEHERIISLLNELVLIFDNSQNIDISFYNIKHGGYIPIKTSKIYKTLYIYNQNTDDNENIKFNIEKNNIENINFVSEPNLNTDVIYIHDELINFPLNDIKSPVILCSKSFSTKISNEYMLYYLTNTDLILCINKNLYANFIKEFHYFIELNTEGINNLNYDNLINYTMIIKNGGELLEKILNENLCIIDRWTILDTGSTDNTIEIIKKVLVGKKKGKLFEEPFINFRDSRNRCLDLAGHDCKFTLMFDDTYVTRGNLREFLNVVRGDQFSDSFSLYLQSHDTQYASNRIIKSAFTNLRYKYKIHEVITPDNNKNVIIPIHHSLVFDYRADYMENRTMDRKQYDLKVLFETIKEEPEDSRAYYYLGQTYTLLEEYELALKYYLERIDHKDEGFIQEKIDACFEAARTCNFKLNRPWEECEKLYKRAYEMDKSRPDSLYFLGIHYFLQAKNNIDPINNYRIAYEHMKNGFEVGYPVHCQYSLKPTLSYYFLPKFLSELCYIFNDFITGQKCSQLFLDINTPNPDGIQPFKEIYNPEEHEIVESWNKIYKCINILPLETLVNVIPEKIISKQILCFLVDGGFEPWTGRDILNKGVGGSETYIIELARYIQRSNKYDVFVFCKCVESDIFEDVQYKPLMEFYSFILQNTVNYCFVSRYSEYIPMCLHAGNIKNVSLILHDLIPSGKVIPTHPKLKKILCLTEWHVEYFSSIFPILKDITESFNYGIDFNLFTPKDDNIQKVPYKFIYSSFAHRGLLPLLQMWPSIIKKYPQASLHIHCDIENAWVNNARPDEMKLIKNILNEYKTNSKLNITYWGWTDKKTLADNWITSDIWFYPCTFLETFCLTALEAALTKTYVITRDFGALKDTVGYRGVFLDSKNLFDPYSDEWQSKALEDLFEILENTKIKNKLIQKNYEWALKMSWKSRADEFINKYLNDTSLPSTTNLNDFIDYVKWKTNNNQIKILEICSNKSIGEEFSKLLPNSSLVSIEHSNNSNDSLTELIKNNETYNFIYINNKNDTLENYSNLILSFKLLKNEGVLLFDIPNNVPEVLNFIKKHENQINIINISDINLLFLEKV
jgi:tetratricopeptide (TPR) repeat protein